MMSTVGLIGLLALVGAQAAEGLTPIRRYALLVGANEGGEDRVVLRYAHSDAESVSRVLTELGGVGANDTLTLLDPDPEALITAFSTLATRLEDGPDTRTEVVFYYSGHSDEEGLLLGGERLGYSALRHELESLPADVRVAIVDSCASGALVMAKGGTMVAPFLVDASTQVEGSAYITSSAADESAQEAERIQGSYFTHYFTSGLRGAADVSRDGRVTLSEAYQFAFDETLARTERTQHGPQHATYDFQLAGTGDLVLTDLQTTSATLVLGEDIEGRIWLRDDGGRLVAELLKPAGRPIILGLAAGEYAVTLFAGGEYGEATLSLAEGESFELPFDDLHWSLTEPTVARGEGLTVEPRHMWFTANLVPHLGPAVPQIDHFALNLGVGRSMYLSGTAIGLGANIVDRDAEGFLGTIGANLVGGHARGFLGSVGVNAAGGDMVGVASSVGANLSGGDMRGVIVSAGANFADGSVIGPRFTAGANIATGEVIGLEVAAGLNVATKGLTGAQISSGANIAGSVRGVQIGIVNIGGTVSGAQIGIVNIGQNVKGAQIGIVNVADEMHGVPIGLVSVVRKGRHDVWLYASESDPFNLELKLGSRHFFSVLGVGGDPTRRQYASAGLGLSVPIQRVWFDLDAQWLSYFDQWQSNDIGPRNILRGRLSFGVQLAPELAIFAGGSINYRPPIDGAFEVGPGWSGAPEQTRTMWPGGFVGLQF